MAKAKKSVPAARKPQKPPSNDAFVPRLPSRGRGILRYKKLLEATEALLTQENPDEVGLYQIAAKAKVPPASVYHFFPTKVAAFLALLNSYNERLAEGLAAPIDASAIRGWQDLAAIDMRRGATFHNEHPPMMKINYGGYGDTATRHVDDVFMRRLALANYGRLNRLFHMPPMTNIGPIFEMRLAIMDGIWGISYRRHGEITDYYFKESVNAVNAFMGQFLPPRLEPRDFLIAAAARGESLSLPFELPQEPSVETPQTKRRASSKP